LYGFSPCQWCTCERYGIDLRDGICPLCNSMNSSAYDPNPNSFDCPRDSHHPPHPTYDTRLTRVIPVETILNLVMIVHLSSRLIMSQNQDTLKTIILVHTIHRVFHSNIFVVKIARDLMKPFSVNQRMKIIAMSKILAIINSFGSDHCQPLKYTVNHPIFNAHTDILNSQNELFISQNKIMEQMTQLTSICEMACQIVQKKLEEKKIEEEQAAKAQNRKLPVCYDDDDDEEESNSLKDNIISELPPSEERRSPEEPGI
nr:hypothetical protein [Tanacetum cinerariifolium]